MSNRQLIQTATELKRHVIAKLQQNHDASEAQLVHHYLAALDLTPTDYHAILDEYRRQTK